MKKMPILLPACFGLLLLLSSCKKENASDDNTTGPIETYPSSGFLCTIGIGHTGAKDTLTYNPWGGGPVAEYGSGLQDADDEMALKSNSNNSVTLYRKIPLPGSTFQYFGSEKNSNPVFSSFPLNAYLFRLYDVKSDETEFILKRDTEDKLKFSLECRTHPGYYLSTAKWKNAVYPTETELVISPVKRLFFFMAS